MAAPEDAPLPQTLRECFADLDQVLGEQERERLRNTGATPADHFGLGLWVRNRYLFREGAVLLDKVRKVDPLLHDDDVSGLILQLYCQHLRGEPLDPASIRVGFRRGLEVSRGASQERAWLELLG